MGVLISLLFKMQKIEVNCHRNSKHTVPFRTWEDSSSGEYFGSKGLLVPGSCGRALYFKLP